MTDSYPAPEFRASLLELVEERVADEEKNMARLKHATILMDALNDAVRNHAEWKEIHDFLKIKYGMEALA